MDGVDFSGGMSSFKMGNVNEKFGQNILNWLMNKNMGLMTGAGTPQDLPWFKGMEEQMKKMATYQQSQAYREAAARGIRGGSLEQIQKAPVEAGQQNVLKAILQQYLSAPNNLANLASTSFDQWAKQRQLLLAGQPKKKPNALMSMISGMMPTMGNIGMGMMGLMPKSMAPQNPSVSNPGSMPSQGQGMPNLGTPSSLMSSGLTGGATSGAGAGAGMFGDLSTMTPEMISYLFGGGGEAIGAGIGALGAGVGEAAGAGAGEIMADLIPAIAALFF